MSNLIIIVKFSLDLYDQKSYIPNKFKKPHRLSDLCDYCEYKREIKIELVYYAPSIGFQSVCSLETLDLD